MIRWAFWLSLLFVSYTYLLYPFAVALLGRMRRRTPAKSAGGDFLPSVTLVIVVFNEEEKIAAKLENCRRLDYPRELLTVCVVSDGSTDGTNAFLEAQPDIVFIRDDENRGKPSQLGRALERCTGEIVLFSDVRQIYREDAIRKIVANFADPAVGAVSGELVFVEPREHTGRSIGLYWTYEKMLRRAESDIDSTLGATGAIYAVRRSLVGPIPADTILDDVEIPLQAFKRGYRVVFEPEALAYDSAASEIEREFKRKVRTLAGNYQLFARNPWLLCPFRNRIFVQSVSHKLFRLLVPYALIVLLGTSYALDGTAFRIFFWLQAGCYAVGILAMRSPALRRNRLANVISVFLAFNAAGVAALFFHAAGKTDVRWKRTGA